VACAPYRETIARSVPAPPPPPPMSRPIAHAPCRRTTAWSIWHMLVSDERLHNPYLQQRLLTNVAGHGALVIKRDPKGSTISTKKRRKTLRGQLQRERLAFGRDHHIRSTLSAKWNRSHGVAVGLYVSGRWREATLSRMIEASNQLSCFRPRIKT
jgi:hypothetical protein